MSETNAPEPTMEEILASIRRIISEDDAPAAEPPSPPAAHASEPAVQFPAPQASSEHGQDDVLELTDRLEPEPVPAPAPRPVREPPPAAPLGDLDFGSAPAAPPPSAARPQPAPAPVVAPQTSLATPRAEEPLVGDGAAGRAADHFGALASTLSMPAHGRTLEDVVRELLRPMLKEWLDQHLATIVEARVQDEVERISRRRTY